MTLRTNKPLKARTPLKRTAWKKPVVKRAKTVKQRVAPLTAKERRELITLLIARDGYACCYCLVRLDRAAMTLDHLLAQSLGGTHHPSNLVISCHSCNSWKNNRGLDWAMANVSARRKAAKVTSHIPMRHTPKSDTHPKGAK